MSVWVKSIDGDESAFKVKIEEGMDFDDLKSNYNIQETFFIFLK